MCFREKSAWVALISTLAVFVPYFLFVFQKAIQNELTRGAVIGAFIGAVIAQTVIQVLVHIAIAIASKREQQDERDAGIDAAAQRNAYMVLCCLTILAAFGLTMMSASSGSSRAPESPNLVFIAQIFYLCFVVAELSRFATQVIRYRLES